ncbi:MAG TPA: hypothetical protein PLI95_25170, partial [Polyangiaceae bacterium]|nr:hypothetical protein [Polyangiaceae bacterium]
MRGIDAALWGAVRSEGVGSDGNCEALGASGGGCASRGGAVSLSEMRADGDCDAIGGDAIGGDAIGGDAIGGDAGVGLDPSRNARSSSSTAAIALWLGRDDSRGRSAFSCGAADCPRA